MTENDNQLIGKLFIGIGIIFLFIAFIHWAPGYPDSISFTNSRLGINLSSTIIGCTFFALGFYLLNTSSIKTNNEDNLNN